MVVFILLACAGEVSEGPEVRDLTREYALPQGEGFQLVTPAVEVQPYSEVFWCTYGTWSEPDVGVDYMQPLFGAYNHHAFVQSASADDPSDGVTTDCTEYAAMVESQPLFDMTGSSIGADGNYLPLPEGVAIKLEEGQRWVIEAHYINPTPDILLVNTAFNFGVMPADEVQVWASSYEFDLGPPSIPADGLYSDSFECSFDSPVSLLSLSGHMHGYGDSFSIYKVSGETESLIYEVEEWEAEYREYPPVLSWGLDEMVLEPTDSLRINCTWDNNSGMELGFPDEMCTAKGLAAPLDGPIGCEPIE